MKLFTIFGDPVSHSRSPLMHNHVFKHLNINACYTRSQLTDGSKLREVFFDKALDGANVTIPHKEAAYNACDEIRGLANEIGAVNTIINENGRLIGYNTDADGFLAAIQSFGLLQNALILGAGGTAKALATVLRQNNIEPTVLNRSANRLNYFRDNGFQAYDWDTFAPDNYNLIINTTSAGLNDEQLPIDTHILDVILNNALCAIDVIYGRETPFLKKVRKLNIPCKDGSDMLLEQGVLANILFVNHTNTVSSIRDIMAKSFFL
jgi:shikimate dehydrogenase